MSVTAEQLVAVLGGTATATFVRDVIVAEGVDTVKFLHSQLSQDLVSMAVGETKWSFLLQPTGKLVALIRVVRSAENTVELDTDAGHGEAVVEALARFKIRTKCELTLRPGVEHAASWSERLPVLVEGEGTFGGAVSDVCAIVRGFPRWGRELHDSTIPNATGLVDRAASFTKGCYTGQELVERIDSRGGNVPRRLVGLVLAGLPDEVGDDTGLLLDGSPAGDLTSICTDPRTGATVGLAYVSRSVDEASSLVTATGCAARVVVLS